MSAAPTRLVVLSPNWLGDAVMALPALADVRRQFAGAHLTVAGRGSVAALFAMVPGDIMLLLMLIPSMLTALSVVREKDLGSIANFYAAPATKAAV